MFDIYVSLTFNQDYHRKSNGILVTYFQGRRKAQKFEGAKQYIFPFLFLFSFLYWQELGGGGKCKKYSTSSTGPIWRQFDFQLWFLINMWTNSLLSSVKRRFILVYVILWNSYVCGYAPADIFIRRFDLRSWFLIRGPLYNIYKA